MQNYKISYVYIKYTIFVLDYKQMIRICPLLMDSVLWQFLSHETG